MTSFYKTKVFIGLVFVLTLTSIFFVSISPSNSNLDQKDHSHASEEEYYTCPMHPQVKEKEPGSCPICHMPLTKVKAKKETKKTSQIAANASNEKRRIKFYRHPMNPKITSKTPAKDDMGMDYIPVYEETSKSEGSPSILGRSDVSF